MCMGIKCGESVDATQRRKKQCLQAVQKCRLAMRQQGKVIARMRVLMRLYRLFARARGAVALCLD